MYQEDIKSVAKRIIAEKSIRLEFVVLEDDSGTKNYFYIFMKGDVYPKFKEAIDKGEVVDLEKYGKVFLQGQGEKPDDEIVNALKELFGDKWTGQ